MLHTLLTLTRPLVVFDTETTGTNTKNDRIIELGFQLFDAGGLQKEWRSLINPGVTIPENAIKIHGIDNDRILRCRVCDLSAIDCTCAKFGPVPFFRDIAPSLTRGFVDCDFAGKNIRFDLEILAAEMSRVNVPWSYGGAHIIDIDRLEQIGEPRTLSTLYRKHTGKALEGAHGALSDVKGSVEVIAAQIVKYDLPRTPADLHAIQWPGWLDSTRRFVLNADGIPVCNFGKHHGVPMNRIPTDYYDWILNNDFPEDVKVLARQAKLGVFPQSTQ